MLMLYLERVRDQDFRQGINEIGRVFELAFWKTYLSGCELSIARFARTFPGRIRRTQSYQKMSIEDRNSVFQCAFKAQLKEFF